MDLQPYVDAVRHELNVAAEAGGADATALADRLSAPLESAFRLALLEALSAAAEEITRELAPGSVHVRLRGREPAFVVELPGPSLGEAAAGDGPSELAGPSGLPPVLTPEGDDGGTSRINLRLPDHLK